jgi:hypothetical protein
MNKKYELTENRVEVGGRTLYQIRAVRSFSNVNEGDLGGWIATEDNLSHDGDCWVFENAWVCDDAKVYGSAKVYGNAWVYGEAWVSGDAEVYGDACVYGKVWVHGDTKVYGRARLSARNY